MLPPRMKPRFLTAFLCLASLAILAGATLQGIFRIAVLVFLAGLAVKLWIAVLKERSED